MAPLTLLMGDDERQGHGPGDGPSRAHGTAASERPRTARSWQGDRAPAGRGERVFRLMAIGVIVIFWLTQFSFLTANRWILGLDTPYIGPRAIVTGCAVPISYLVFCILRRARGRSLSRRAFIALGLALAGCAAHSAVNLVALILFRGVEWSIAPADYAIGLANQMVAFIWYYLALAVMLLALTYGQDLVENEERIASLQAQANAAQLDALRYQLKPHFLFNTLNSVASLISKKMGAEAEAMVVSLSDFLRSTLRMDFGHEITLAEEIRLQSLYLDIERIRFPQRLKVTVDVPDDLRDACVPNLITQPLIENAIKHGVRRSTAAVHLEVIARRWNGRLSLEIRDDGGNAGEGAPPSTTQVGLRNVAERLRLRFGSEASLIAGRRPGGGFSARILMPLRTA